MNKINKKLRGGFYTPTPIANFLLKWALNGSNELDILEPSCGDGVFLKALKTHQYKYKSITAIEYDKNEADKAKQINLNNKTVINDDFHKFCIETNNRFDVVIGNPPYIRSQDFNKQQQELAATIFSKAGLPYTKLTNAWVSFVIGSSLLLKDTGKIAFVIPAEILQVSYAQKLREFLSRFYNKISIISFQTLVFPKVQQEVVLLLCEKDLSNKHLVDYLELYNTDELIELNLYKINNPQKNMVRSTSIDRKFNKWIIYLLSQKEIGFIKRILEEQHLPALNNLADLTVGITTGSNNYFTLTQAELDKYKLHKYAKPLLSKTAQVPGAVFSYDNWLDNCKTQSKTHLLILPTANESNNDSNLKEYLAWGQDQGINKGYKCRNRKEWQIIPSTQLSNAFLTRRSNVHPRLITNQVQAHTTESMHRLDAHGGMDLNAICASFYNSLTFALAECLGRNYGGGVLELMTSEAKQLLIPYHDNHASLLTDIDSMLKDKKSIHDVLQITDQKVLKQTYGFSKDDIELANSIWLKLSNRRIHRGNKRT